MSEQKAIRQTAAFEAATAYLETPDELADLFATYARAKQDRNPPQPATVDPTRVYFDGGTLADAQDLADRNTATLARWERERTTAGIIAERAQRALADYIVGHRDDLIENTIRSAVRDIMDEAVPLAESLDRYAFDADRVLASADKKTIDAWRRSRELDTALRTVRELWLRLWSYGKPGSRKYEGVDPLHWKPRRPGGVHVWQTPEAVTDHAVMIGRHTDVLDIAKHHNAGRYQLASLAEFCALVRDHEMNLATTVAGKSLGVWTVGEPKTEGVRRHEKALWGG